MGPDAQTDGAKSPQKACQYPWDVTQFDIVLTSISLRALAVCATDATITEGPLPPSVQEKAELVRADENSFTGDISWTLVFPEGQEKWFSVEGCHRLRFTHRPNLPAHGAKYYVTVNSYILLFPYLRQLISDLASRATGRTLLLKPLDVPAYVAKRDAVFKEQILTASSTDDSGDNAENIQQDASDNND